MKDVTNEICPFFLRGQRNGDLVLIAIGELHLDLVVWDIGVIACRS
jgi:hypothetical protein